MAVRDDKVESIDSPAEGKASPSSASRFKTQEPAVAPEDFDASGNELSLIYRNVADTIFSLLAESPEQFRLTSANPAFLSMIGLSESQVIGKLLHEILAEPTLHRVQDACQSACQHKQTVQWGDKTPAGSGTKAVEGSITPIFDEAGNCTKLIGIIHDVTERRRAAELRLRLAAVVESSDDAIISKTLQGIISTWNAGAETTFGYTAEEAIGKPITLLIPPDRQDEEPRILDQIRSGHRVHHYETVRMRKDGRLIDVSLTVSPVKNEQGRVVGVSKIARDITEQKRARHALEEERRNLEWLNNVAAALGSTLDRQTLVQRVTYFGREMTGAAFGAYFYNLVNESGESYVLYALSGAPREAFDRFGLPRNTPIFSPTFSGHSVVRSDDITKDPLPRRRSSIPKSVSRNIRKVVSQRCAKGDGSRPAKYWIL